MNSRIETLLKIFTLQDRQFEKIKKSGKWSEIDFGHVHAIIQRKRNEALSYLNKALSGID